MFFALTLSDYSRHPRGSRLRRNDASRNAISRSPLPQSPSSIFCMHTKNRKFPQKYSNETFKPYFCLDTSLNRTLAYAHWCNWGNVLEDINICSHLRFAGETVVALSATIRHWTSPSLKRSGPAHDLDPIAGGNSVSPAHPSNVEGTAPVEKQLAKVLFRHFKARTRRARKLFLCSYTVK
jgi:hypothetical protein